MPIAKNKQELVDSMELEFRLLKEIIEGHNDEQMTAPGVCHKWSVKDVLAHLVEWERMFFGWYEAGLRGEKPKTPADDLKWSQTASPERTHLPEVERCASGGGASRA